MAPKRLLVAVALLAALGGAAVLLYPGARQAPDVTFTLLDGERLHSAQLHGRPVLITFWATTCAPCIKELPDLIALYRELNPHGFDLIAVAVREDPPALVLEMKKKENIPYPIALDLDGSAAKAYGVQFIPRSFLLDAAGRIVLEKTGKLDIAALRMQVVSLLEEKT